MLRKCIGVVAFVVLLVTVFDAPDTAARRIASRSFNGGMTVHQNRDGREAIRDFRFDDQEDQLPNPGGGGIEEEIDENEGHDWEGAQVINNADSGFLFLSIPWLGISFGQFVPIWISYQSPSNTPAAGESSYIPKVPNQEKTDHGVTKGKKRLFGTARSR
jgi:hypothetical protein